MKKISPLGYKYPRYIKMSLLAGEDRPKYEKKLFEQNCMHFYSSGKLEKSLFFNLFFFSRKNRKVWKSRKDIRLTDKSGIIPIRFTTERDKEYRNLTKTMAKLVKRRLVLQHKLNGHIEYTLTDNWILVWFYCAINDYESTLFMDTLKKSDYAKKFPKIINFNPIKESDELAEELGIKKHEEVIERANKLMEKCNKESNIKEAYTK